MTVAKKSSFQILNASAGSGKTFNLVKEYIKLLIHDPDNTRKFTNIIAMTFTNMAALEMKTRIISSMDMLSHPERTGSKAEGLATLIAADLGLKKDEVFKRAASVMRQMLHSYEDFSVMTIDKFNLRLIRSFSRDLDLPADFDVVMNEDLVIEQVVDLLLSRMGSSDMVEFTRLALRYSAENLDEGESWDFRRSLIGFGTNFSKEKDQPTLERLIGEDITEDSLAELREEMKALEEEFSALAIEANQLISGYCVDSSVYPQGSKLVGRIEKMAGGLRADTENLSDTLKTVIRSETPKGKFFPDELRSVLQRIDAFKDAYNARYNLIAQYARNFYNVALLRYLAGAIEDMKKKERIIRISEFNKLISNLVRNEDAPFIYERLGIRYQHFLLDEFQDTSRLQWLNMVPLVHESLSQRKFNLIVGDPKQSIYRFKNGVAEQFVELPGIYNPEKDASIAIKSDFFRKEGEVIPLPDNWRSAPEIVHFNNALFTLLREQLPDRSSDFYNSVEQFPRSAHPGLVQIRSFQSKGAHQEQIRLEVLAAIDACLQDNYFKSDICVLTETNNTANEWALTLKAAGHDVVSAESLLLDNDLKVNLTVSYLKIRLKPSVASEMKKFAEIFFRIRHQDNFSSYTAYLKKGTDKSGKTFTYFDAASFQIEQFGSAARFFCGYETLYDLVQRFYIAMGWNELTDPYLHHFGDFVYDFEQSKGPDLSGLIDHYEEKKKSLAIQTPVSDNAIVVMTIHKSKGLEFPVVIVPDLDFDTSIRNTSKFLVEADELILHTTLSKSSKIDAVRKLHADESDHILTDKMNLCYVALTRPEFRLYAFNPNNDKGFGKIFDKVFTLLPDAISENNVVTVSRGEPSTRIPRAKSETVFFRPEEMNDRLWFPEIALKDDSSKEKDGEYSDDRRFGDQLHALMSEINTIDELSSRLEKLIHQGVIESKNVDRIRDLVHDLFDMTAFRTLFEGNTEIISERSLILDEESIRRPDKVVIRPADTVIIDFKTGTKRPSHEKQMREYITAYQQMEFPDVKGYLLYTNGPELVRIL